MASLIAINLGPGFEAGFGSDKYCIRTMVSLVAPRPYSLIHSTFDDGEHVGGM